MLNKILSLILVCGLIFSFAACGNIQKPTESSKVDTAENESKVFAGDNNEADNGNNEIENADKGNAVQKGVQEKVESHQTVSSEETPIKQESELELTQKPVTSELVSSDIKIQKNENSSKKQTADASQGNATTSSIISKSKAKSIALKHADVNENKAFDLDIELDRDNGTLHYDIDFEVGNTDYEYEIDATSGKILFSKSEKDNDNKHNIASSSKPQKTEPKISKAKAESIVFKHAGLNKADVREYEMDFDIEAGYQHYEIDFKYQGFEYAYKVNAETGEIALFEKERD